MLGIIISVQSIFTRRYVLWLTKSVLSAFLAVAVRLPAPVGAISQGADKFEINPEVCISCGACAAQCPVSAISEE